MRAIADCKERGERSQESHEEFRYQLVSRVFRQPSRAPLDWTGQRSVPTQAWPDFSRPSGADFRWAIKLNR